MQYLAYLSSHLKNNHMEMHSIKVCYFELKNLWSNNWDEILSESMVINAGTLIKI